MTSAATTESIEQRKERWIEWTSRAMQFCPLNLYDEFQKLGEIAVGEMLTEIDRARDYARNLGGWFDDDE